MVACRSSDMLSFSSSAISFAKTPVLDCRAPACSCSSELRSAMAKNCTNTTCVDSTRNPPMTAFISMSLVEMGYASISATRDTARHPSHTSQAAIA